MPAFVCWALLAKSAVLCLFFIIVQHLFAELRGLRANIRFVGLHITAHIRLYLQYVSVRRYMPS